MFHLFRFRMLWASVSQQRNCCSKFTAITVHLEWSHLRDVLHKVIANLWDHEDLPFPFWCSNQESPLWHHSAISWNKGTKYYNMACCFQEKNLTLISGFLFWIAWPKHCHTYIREATFTMTWKPRTWSLEWGMACHYWLWEEYKNWCPKTKKIFVSSRPENVQINIP